MSNYIYTNGQLYNVDELMHYGVPGMKWGRRKQQRIEKRAVKKYARFGERQGAADYYKRRSSEIAKDYNNQAKLLEKNGHFVRANAARRRGMKLSAESEKYARKYEAKAKKLLAKADKYANKKQVNLGKKKINSIVKDWKTSGKIKATNDEIDRRRNEQQRYVNASKLVLKDVIGYYNSTRNNRNE